MDCCMPRATHMPGIESALEQRPTRSGSKASARPDPSERRPMTPYRVWLCVPKLYSERGGDATQPGLDVQLRARPAGSGVRLVRPCSVSGTFGYNYSNRHRLAGFCADAPRPERSHALGIRAGSIRSVARHIPSAKATLVQWACPGYPSPAAAALRLRRRCHHDRESGNAARHSRVTPL